MPIRVLKCFQCGHSWVTGRQDNECPKCHSRDWYKPKKEGIIR